jgi:two-component system, sensor histidine kinase
MFTKSMQLFSDSKNHTWNLGTWVLLMLILLSGSYISYYLRTYTDSLLLYLPTSLAFVMVHWFGPRILPLAFINAFVTLYLWQAPGEWDRILLLASREPVIVFASWFLCRDLVYSSKGLSDTKSFSRFILLGIVVPDLINSLYTYNYTFVNGDLEKVSLLWLSDFITIFSIGLPLLHFFTPIKTKYFFKLVTIESKVFESKYGNNRALSEFIGITLLFVVLGFVVSFDKYWFLYGIGATFLAVRHGFNYVVLVNSVIFILNYILPFLKFESIVHRLNLSTELLNVHLGMGTMFFGSALIGRVICDLQNSEKELTNQKKQIESTNSQLSKANHEMDRFVYSVSHDISAPLKSIRGLIAISKMESNNSQEFPYLSRIEQSVNKLEDFTEEILEHSRASRKEIAIEEINLHSQLNDIFDNLKYLVGYDTIRFNIQLDYPLVKSDPFLLKVMLSNLISNAIKFQRQEVGVTPEIRIRSYATDKLFIEVADNGEGIREDFKNRIFEMFYRATTTSNGSGLGLFIAKESAVKLNGEISFKTTYGEGSTFIIELPIHN